MKLLGYYKFKGTLTLKTGLRIGASKEQMAIGDIDNPVLRNPLTDEPYIPGSSIKGKMRYLLEWNLGGDYITNADDKHVFFSMEPNDPVCKIFGSAASNEDQRSILRQRGPGRLLVRDAFLTPESRDELGQMTGRGGIYTEAKEEVFISRVGGNANPRTAERVPAGAVFDFEMVYRIIDMGNGDNGKSDKTDLQYVKNALEMLQLDGLGGYISRGYGQVELNYQLTEHYFEQPTHEHNSPQAEI